MLLILTAAKNAQSQAMLDSLGAVTAMKNLLAVCKSVDFADPKTTSLGTFYKAAQYIVYRGDNRKRAWKEFANYRKAEDKRGVDEICAKINETVNRDANYQVIKYQTKKESEGLWHILFVTYKKQGVEKHAIYAFLKIGKRFGLGDID